MRYLITGGAGFIGTHLARHLLAQGHQVLSLDRRHADSPVEGVTYIQGDVRDHRLLAPLLDGVEGIFHLAAVVGFANVMSQMRETIVTNTAGTELVLHYAQLKAIPVLLTSTSACYGRATNQGVPVQEDQDGILGPTSRTSWSYAYAKAVDEALAFAYHREYGLPVVVARLFNTVGPGQSALAGFVLPRFVDAALAGEPLTVHAPGTQVRTFGHVSDVVHALAALMRCPAAIGELVNVGGRARVTMAALAAQVIADLHSTSTLAVVPAPYGAGYDNVTDREPDLTKLTRLTGLTPVLTLTDMIRDVALYALMETI